MTDKPNKQMVMVSCETLMDLHLAAYSFDDVTYPTAGQDIRLAQEEARQALYDCGWWQNGDED